MSNYMHYNTGYVINKVTAYLQQYEYIQTGILTKDCFKMVVISAKI